MKSLSRYAVLTQAEFVIMDQLPHGQAQRPQPQLTGLLPISLSTNSGPEAIRPQAGTRLRLSITIDDDDHVETCTEALHP